jgi:hypothetical protein
MSKATFEAWYLRVRGALAEILCHESNGDEGFSIRVSIFVIYRVAIRIPNHEGKFHKLDPLIQMVHCFKLSKTLVLEIND